MFQPGRDDDLAFRFGFDPGVGAMGYLAFALWPLGEVDRAISVIERMQERIAEISHAGSLIFGRLQAALFELMRGDPARAEPTPPGSPASRATTSSLSMPRPPSFSRAG